MKIPAWVGYAIDPVGAVKNKVMEEVRGRTKTALKAEFAKLPGTACVAPDAAIEKANEVGNEAVNQELKI